MHEKQGDIDARQALLVAKRIAHGSTPLAGTTCIRSLIVGYREG